MSNFMPESMFVVTPTAWGEYGLIASGLGAPPGLRPPTPDPVAPTPFSQRDPRWAMVRLGTSPYTMSNAGCAVTACTMVASVVEPGITPLELATWLNAHVGFTTGGLLQWARVAEFVPGLRFVAYQLWRDIPADLTALKAALVRFPQVVQVDFRPLTTALDSHFVTALGATADGADLYIIDPWTGQAGTLRELYAQPTWALERAVYAWAHFERQQ